MNEKRRTLIAVAAGAAGLGAATAAFLWNPRPRPGSAGESTRPSTDNAGLRAHESPRPLPSFPFEDGDGRRRSLADFRGRHVLLNVWATWCAPCREEMPSLERLQEKLGGPDFQVLALSVDSGGTEAVHKFYAELGLKALGVYVDRSLQVHSALRIVGLPSTLLLDREGREIARYIGPAQWDSAPLVESIVALTRADRR